jgi:hypothetical protein
MKTTIYILATDGKNGTEAHGFTTKKAAFDHLADFLLCESSAAEAKGIYAHHGWNEEVNRIFHDEELRNDPLSSYSWEEFTFEDNRLESDTSPTQGALHPKVIEARKNDAWSEVEGADREDWFTALNQQSTQLGYWEFASARLYALEEEETR